MESVSAIGLFVFVFSFSLDFALLHAIVRVQNMDRIVSRRIVFICLLAFWGCIVCNVKVSDFIVMFPVIFRLCLLVPGLYFLFAVHFAFRRVVV
jgi:hypothetical protein